MRALAKKENESSGLGSAKAEFILEILSTS
jgi:hypothetical protein